MKTFKVTLTDDKGVIIERYDIGAYTKAEAEELFDKGGADAVEVYEWVEIDGPGDVEDLSRSIAENIRQQFKD